MRVLFWSEGFWPSIGGVEVLAAKLVPALAQRGHEILVVTDDDRGRLSAHDAFRSVPIRRLSMRDALLAHAPDRVGNMQAAVTALIEEHAPDVVHLNCMGPTAFFLRRSAQQRMRPMLVTVHSASPLSLGSNPTLVAQLLTNATWVSAVCAGVLATARERVPEITERSSIIYNAVDEPDERLQPLPFDPPTIMCLGRLAPEKALDRALDAFARLRSSYAGLRLVICGEGPQRATLAAHVRALGVQHDVTFTGWINPARVAEILNTATLLLMPSRWEGLPLAAIEAALMARPIIGTRVGGLPELIEDGVSGLLSDPTPDALAAAVRTLLDDPAGAIRMGQIARERARQRFLLPHCVDSYHRMYEKLGAEVG